jgi:hypothetical protein
MSSFTVPLLYESTDTFRGGRSRRRMLDGVEVCELVGARRLFRITRGFVYVCERTGLSIPVDEGFLCDLGSIPGFARGWLSPDDPWAAAFVLHDWLYRSKMFDRLTCDLILWDALGLPYRAYDEADRMYRVVCPSLARTAIYYAVRAGGRAAYA